MGLFYKFCKKKLWNSPRGEEKEKELKYQYPYPSLPRGECSVHGELTPTLPAPCSLCHWLHGRQLGSHNPHPVCDITFKTEVEGSPIGMLGVNPEGREDIVKETRTW